MSIDLDAIRARHLRPEQMEHRTFYEGHIVIDLAALVDEVERLRTPLGAMALSADELAEIEARRAAATGDAATFQAHAVSDVSRLIRHIEALRYALQDARERETWLEHAVEVTDAARCDDRAATVTFLRDLGHDAAADAVAKAGFPLWACLPLVTEVTMTKAGGNTDD